MKKNICFEVPDVEHSMCYEEREKLKSFTYYCERENDTASLARVLILIAHWFRLSEKVSFTEYASHYIAANKNTGKFGASSQVMQDTWPLTQKCRIREGNCYFRS